MAEAGLFQDAVDNLKPHQVIFIMDWKMKIEEMYAREGQADYFAKSGSPYHGIACIRLYTEQELHNQPSSVRGKEVFQSKYKVEFIDHCIDNVKENGETLCCILETSFKLYKEENNHVNESLLFSDGGPCYIPQVLYSFMSTLGDLTGLRVGAHYISEVCYLLYSILAIIMALLIRSPITIPFFVGRMW